MSDEETLDQAKPVAAGKRGLASRSSVLVSRGLRELLAQASRTLHFPADRSMGKLWLKEPEDSILLGEARGDVTVPLRSKVWLEVSPEALHGPLPLLRPNDLHTLTISFHPEWSNLLDRLGDPDKKVLRERLGWSGPSLKPVEEAAGRLGLSVESIVEIEARAVRTLRLLSQGRGWDFLWAKLGDMFSEAGVRPSPLDSVVGALSSVTDGLLGWVQGLTGLRGLNLSNSWITDAGIAHVRALGALEELSAGRTKLTDAGLRYLADAKRLRGLDLRGTRISDAGLAHLGGLTALETLGLVFTQVTDAGVSHLRGMKNLRALALGGTRISDAGLAHLGGLTALETLRLEGTEITDAGLAHLQGLTALQELSLTDTKVSDVGLREMRRARPNLHVDR